MTAIIIIAAVFIILVFLMKLGADKPYDLNQNIPVRPPRHAKRLDPQNPLDMFYSDPFNSSGYLPEEELEELKEDELEDLKEDYAHENHDDKEDISGFSSISDYNSNSDYSNTSNSTDISDYSGSSGTSGFSGHDDTGDDSAE